MQAKRSQSRLDCRANKSRRGGGAPLDGARVEGSLAVRFMHRDCQDGQIGWPTFAGLALLVVAFMVLSLLVTATGTARFAIGMGYDAKVGYAVGALFDLAKGAFLVAVLAFWRRRSLGFAAVFGTFWICLVTFSSLATHGTVTTAISSIDRSGTWKMEVRSNTKAELTSVEQQLAALSRPAPPRPSATVREALAAERVPGSVWQDSRECRSIQDSAYFMRACAQVVQLRRELAASEDYERLSARATELRKGLADAPIVATSDPLPTAFSATLGRLVPLGGSKGVALLLTSGGREDREGSGGTSGREGPFTPPMRGSLEGASLSPGERPRVHSTTLPNEGDIEPSLQRPPSAPALSRTNPP
jgi:hypothetical protein